LVAGSSQGYSGHVDGKPIDARFKLPKGVTNSQWMTKEVFIRLILPAWPFARLVEVGR
jgi:hypothetical protein